MSIITDIDFQNDILFVKISGIYSTDAVKANFGIILESLTNHNTNKVLIDTLKLENITRSVFQAYDYARFVSNEIIQFKKQGDTRDFRFAYLYEEKYKNVLKFGELVAINRGMKTKAFINFEDAISWLQEE